MLLQFLVLKQNSNLNGGLIMSKKLEKQGGSWDITEKELHINSKFISLAKMQKYFQTFSQE